jgi:AcrR family transcriptional regulator
MSDTLMDARSARTRGALLRAGFDLLVDRSIDAISVNDLVASAGVAKGSFFNHFADKQDFAEAIANDVRIQIEDAIGRAKVYVSDPVARLAQGVLVPVEMALSQPKLISVMLRSAARTTLAEHPLNRGVRADIKACVSEGLLRPEATGSGMIFWLGVCQAVTRNITERALRRAAAAHEAYKFLVMGLSGLGIDQKNVVQVAEDGYASIQKAMLRRFLLDKDADIGAKCFPRNQRDMS